MDEIQELFIRTLREAARIEEGFLHGLNMDINKEQNLRLRAEINPESGLFDIFIDSPYGSIEYISHDNYKKIVNTSVSLTNNAESTRTLFIKDPQSVQAYQERPCPVLSQIIGKNGRPAQELELNYIKDWIKMFVAHHKNLKILLQGTNFKSAQQMLDTIRA